MSGGRRSPSAAGTALIGVLLLVAAVSALRSLWLAPVWHLPVALALAAATVVIGRRAGLDGSDLGLGSWRRGAMYGVGAGAVVILVLVAAGLAAGSIGVIADLFDDERATIDLAELLVRALVIIPVGTALVEEVIFRGVVLGLLLRSTGRGRAVVASSIIFGLWHLLPVGLDTAGTTSDVVRAVLATFVITTVAGIGFAALRLVSGSLLAPVIAHTATNSGALVVAWVVA